MKNPEKNNIHSTFSGSVRYVAPVYQRYYVWRTDELEALLDDIENAADENSLQFIGAIVVQDFGKKGGNKSPNEYLIIDGQQRLTTLYLLICGLSYCYLKTNKKTDAEKLVKTYLSFSEGEYVRRPKLLPTIQDRKQLFRILENEIDCIAWDLDNESIDDSSKRTAITTQWKNITKYFNEVFFDTRNRLIRRKIDRFEKNIKKYVEHVQITLEPKDDANTVFSKLNYRGITLSVSDLVRNDIFSRLDENNSEVLDDFYKQVWKPFETSFPNKSFDQYITIYSTIIFKGKYSKARSFPELQKSWSNKKPVKIVKELEEYADIYIALVEFTPLIKVHKDVNESIRRISMMPKTTVTWPYILQTINAFRRKEVSKKQVIDCLSLVESFLVRRAIAGLEPTGLHAVFKTLWNKAGADKKKLSKYIVSTTIRCPNDSVIKDAISLENMYKRKISKYLLIQLELTYNKKNGYDNATSDFSVEHILPKNLTKEWGKFFTKQEHILLVNTIGNLTPLTKGQNSKIKDHEWNKKREFFKGSNWKITQKVSRSQKWTKTQVTRRTKELTSWILEEWPELK